MKKKLISACMAIMMAVGFAIPSTVFAAGAVEVKVSAGGYSQGQMTATMNVEIRNQTGGSVTDVNVTVTNPLPSGQSGVTPSAVEPFSLEDGKTVELSYSIDLQNAILGKYYYPEVKVEWKEGTSQKSTINNTSLKVEPSVYDNTGKPNQPITLDNNSDYVTQTKLEVSVPAGGLNSGATSYVELKITNKGNSRINNVYATFAPGASMSLTNFSTEQRIGVIEKGATQVVRYPIFVDADHTGGNTPLAFTIKGTDPNGKEFTDSITEYVMVNAGSSSSDSLEIINIQNPGSVALDQTFSLKFSVRNQGSQALKNIKVSVEPTAPVVNRTKNIFVINLEAGEAKAFDVQMFAAGSAEVQSQNYPIKITVEPSGKNATPVTQYAGVFVNGGNNSKTVPQIIIL